MRNGVLVCALVVLCSSDVNAKRLKFLFFAPTYGHSHLQFNGALADILVDAGHTAHVLIPELIPGMKTNGTVKAQRVIRFTPSGPSLLSVLTVDRNPFTKHAIDISRLLREFSIIGDVLQHVCEDILKDKELIDQLRAEHYDVGFTEFISYCSVGLMRHIGVKSTAFLSAMSVPDLLAHAWALPTPPSYVTDMFRSYVNAPRLTTLQRAHNFLSSAFVRSMSYSRMIASENRVFKRLVGEDFPDLEVLVRDVSVAFINTPQLVDLPRPISSRIVHIGGIALKEPSKLSEKFSSILDHAKHGVVLFSFGSLIRSGMMPPAVLSAFLDAFSRYSDYEFILKMDRDHSKDDVLLAKYPNIHAFEWIDQVNILGHPSTKAFITHAGLNSVIESMYSGTPMICIPLCADQEYNTAMALQKNVAVYVDKTNITTDTIADALNMVLNDARYAENSRILRDKLHNYPMNSKQMFLKWSEYLGEFGMSSELDLHGSGMGLIQYFSLDILLVCSSIVICLLLVTLKVAAWILRMLWKLCASVMKDSTGSRKAKDE